MMEIAGEQNFPSLSKQERGLGDKKLVIRKKQSKKTDRKEARPNNESYQKDPEAQDLKIKYKEKQSHKSERRSKILKDLLSLSKGDIAKHPSENFKIRFVEEKK